MMGCAMYGAGWSDGGYVARGAAPEAMGCSGSSWLPCSLLMGTKARIRLLQSKGTHSDVAVSSYKHHHGTKQPTERWELPPRIAVSRGGCTLEPRAASIPTAFGDEVHVRMQHGCPVESHRPASREATTRQGTGAGMLQGRKLAPAPSPQHRAHGLGRERGWPSCRESCQQPSALQGREDKG